MFILSQDKVLSLKDTPGLKVTLLKLLKQTGKSKTK
jgi:hypothetical protein